MEGALPDAPGGAHSHGLIYYKVYSVDSTTGLRQDLGVKPKHTACSRFQRSKDLGWAPLFHFFFGFKLWIFVLREQYLCL